MPTYIILGAGVLSLTTAQELLSRYPKANVTVVAKHHPGDRAAEYASPWAGANWCSAAHDGGDDGKYGRQEGWDRLTYLKFLELTKLSSQTGISNRSEEIGEKGCNEMGILPMKLVGFFDNEIQEAGVLSTGTGKIWYEDFLKEVAEKEGRGQDGHEYAGFRFLEKEEIRDAKWGFEIGSFVVDTGVYLGWLRNEARRNGVQFQRRSFEDIQELFDAFPNADAYFNCTGLGACSLKGVEDKNVYPTRGQVLLVENPQTPLTRMYFRSPQRVDNDTTYVFPRGLHGGVVLGGCRIDNDWNGTVDLEFAEDIKKRCCELAPELGRPEDLKVLSHGVGLRPSRKGGARVEKEKISGRVVVHNYGAGGAGYQASWGMAKEAVDLLQKDSKL